MEIRDLTVEEVKVILDKYPKARPIPVKNFLFSQGANESVHNATMNFGADAQSYRWDTHIQKAIRTGIDVGCGRKRIVDGKIISR